LEDSRLSSLRMVRKREVAVKIELEK